MRARNTITNVTLHNKRKDQVYQSVITDLCLFGVISKETYKEMMGYDFPSYIVKPGEKYDPNLRAQVAEDNDQED